MIKLYTKNKFSAKLLTLVLLVTTVFYGCKKTDNVDTSTGAPPDLVTKINSSVSGFITDENDLPVKNATVQFGTSVLSSDKYGYFEAKDIEVIKDVATVIVTRTGYFKAIKTFIAVAGKAAFFRIKLIPKIIAGTLSGNTGGTVTLTNGLSVSLPAGSVVNATTNAAYTGTVNVAAYWINPTSTDLPNIMPGDLRGINTAGNLKLLTTYGMAAVELTGTAGELLQIVAGKKATLSLPVPTALAATAPATIPLWYFDEVKGLWKEEGVATKTGSKYVGEVSHFSFWNYDVPANYVQFNCAILSTNGQPFQNVLIKISVVNNPASMGFGYTDQSGYVHGAVPANARLLLEIFATPTCTSSSYSQTFTTGNTDLSLGTITSSIPVTTVSGTVTNCNNMPVANGCIIVQNGATYYSYPLTNNGTYNFIQLLCNSNTNFILTGIDYTNLQQSSPLSYTLSTSGNVIIPNIQACGLTALQYFNYTLNGINYTFMNPPDSIRQIVVGVPLRYYIEANSINNHANLFFEGTNMALGSQQAFVAFYHGRQLTATVNNPITVTITEYGAIGQYVAGNFSGTLIDITTNTTYNVNCNFRIKRIF